METHNLNDFTIPLSSDKAFILMNSEMILRKNAEVEAEFIKVQKQINELMHTRAKLEEMKKAYSAMVEKLPPHRRAQLWDENFENVASKKIETPCAQIIT